MFLDWISLIEPAAPVADDRHELLQTLTHGSDAEAIRIAFARLSVAVEGIRERDWDRDLALTNAFIGSSRRELENGSLG